MNNGTLVVSRKLLELLACKAEVFDDGTDGADAESARSVAQELRALLVKPEENVIDLDALDWRSIQQAASESKWMPLEYMRNEWVSDVCTFLRERPTVQRQDDVIHNFIQWFNDCGKQAMQHELGIEDLMEGAYEAGVKAAQAKNHDDPVAYLYQYSTATTCEGHVGWREEIEREKPPQWMIDEGKVTGLTPLCAQPAKQPEPVDEVVQGTDFDAHVTKLQAEVERLRFKVGTVKLQNAGLLKKKNMAFSERTALQLRLNTAEQRNVKLSMSLKVAYQWGYGDGQNNPNGYSSNADIEACVADLSKPTDSAVSE